MLKVPTETYSSVLECLRYTDDSSTQIFLICLENASKANLPLYIDDGQKRNCVSPCVCELVKSGN